MKKEAYKKLYCGDKLFNTLTQRKAIFIEIKQPVNKRGVLVRVLEKDGFDDWVNSELSLGYFLEDYQLRK